MSAGLLLPLREESEPACARQRRKTAYPATAPRTAQHYTQVGKERKLATDSIALAPARQHHDGIADSFEPAATIPGGVVIAGRVVCDSQMGLTMVYIEA